ncbi:hypothetical protein ABT008_14735 [Micromonospora sp. NPDC002389]|uniref:hypothetical protein n=1 Tax=Micromonospora sp. NPDC002389 TaxID=3154272 RepID=UPI003317026E
MSTFPRLSVLLCDTDAGRLYQELTRSPLVRRLVVAGNLDAAARHATVDDFDVIVLDPLSTGLVATGELALDRSEDGVAIVLHVDLAEVEAQASVFYHGERARLKGMFTLDRRTSPAGLAAEANEVLIKCQAFRLLAGDRMRADRLLDEVRESAARPDGPGPAGTVFLSCSDDRDDDYVRLLHDLLARRGFAVRSGRDCDNGQDAAVLDGIRGAGYVVSLMTRERPIAGTGRQYATHACLIEEKGAALALDKPLVLLVEQGVDDVGGLSGGWQRVHRFTPTTFGAVAHAAVAELAAYGGGTE